ncbi:hypothetical protein L323_14895 [Ruminiclostridium papyrosolvens C7]|uniref:Uncharacterized protein n=1 Tax=Ruminiclostridium papyrosolvens C7 TaxID=1330534 RepID=U4R054_9FIRM|nr:hypothetical protein L323_14895 [Ruminiclostridium papyrosolvens C7]
MSQFQISIGAFWVIFWTLDLALSVFIVWLCEKNAKRIDIFFDKVDEFLNKVQNLCKLKRKSPHC